MRKLKYRDTTYSQSLSINQEDCRPPDHSLPPCHLWRDTQKTGNSDSSAKGTGARRQPERMMLSKGFTCISYLLPKRYLLKFFLWFIISEPHTSLSKDENRCITLPDLGCKASHWELYMCTNSWCLLISCCLFPWMDKPYCFNFFFKSRSESKLYTVFGSGFLLWAELKWKKKKRSEDYFELSNILNKIVICLHNTWLLQK